MSADVEAYLSAHPLTQELPSPVRRRLTALASVVELAAGEVLVKQRDPGDAAYLIVQGRLTASVDGVDVGVVRPGETVGEMALLTGDPRSATVTARRASLAVRLGADDFVGVLADHPEVYRSLTQMLIGRLDRTLSGAQAGAGYGKVISISSHQPELGSALADHLLDCFSDQGVRAVLTSDDPEALRRLEVDHEAVIVTASVDRLARRARAFDKSVLVVDGRHPPQSTDHRPATDVVVVHHDDVVVPAGTHGYIDAAASIRHHHLRLGRADDGARFCRRLLDRERVLVLGGGGARGLAHLGTYRALSEAGVDIDAVVGVSAGALFAACIALDWSPEQAVERSTAILVDAGRLIDFTVPLVAISSGRRITEAIKNGYGPTVDLEDLWRPMTCVSADLSTLSARQHDTGRLWRALRASVAVPGVFPPLIEDDAILVDGGVVENLPVTRARALYPGATIISSEVGRRSEALSVDLPGDGIVGGWRSTWERLGRRRRTPSMVSLLYRLTALGGGATDNATGDIHITPNLEGIGIFDFAHGREAIEAGYQATKVALAESDLSS